MHLLCFVLAFLPQSPTVSPDTSALAPDTPVVPLDRQMRVARAHYDSAAVELERADVSCLTVEQRVERARLIALLRDYSTRGEFGLNEESPGARVPLFVDHAGRRCAVAELLRLRGERASVASVHEYANHAWVCELSDDAHFRAWLEKSGLTLVEAARIQWPPNVGPGDFSFGAHGQVPPHSSPTPGYGGPGDTSPSAHPHGGAPRPTGDTPSTSSGSGGPATGGGGGGNGPTSTPHISTADLTLTEDDGWELWWEYNKVEFMRPNRLQLDPTLVTGDDPAEALRRAADQARESALPIFLAGLDNPDAQVRAAAEVALGRAGHDRGVESLLTKLADPNLAVRERAIVSLGATDSVAAATALLALARTGCVTSSGARVSPNARPLAVVGLALMRMRGFESSLDAAIAEIVDQRPSAEAERLGVAAMIYATLAPSEVMQETALRLALDEHESPSVRCRATEALRQGTDEKTLGKLQSLLHGPRMDVRRSAALALGEYHNDLAVPALKSALELEVEPLAHGFLTISLGRRATDDARACLAGQIAHSSASDRRWSALALGVLARRTHDAALQASVAPLLANARERERNRDAMGAHVLAAGLANDASAFDFIVQVLTSSGDPLTRMHAAHALALLGDERSHAALVARLSVERQPLARVGAAQGIAIFGRTADTPRLIDVLHTTNEPELASQVSSAISFLGTPTAVSALLDECRRSEVIGPRRAAAIEGLGMLLADAAPLRLSDASRTANYTVFTDWVRDLFQTTL